MDEEITWNGFLKSICERIKRPKNDPAFWFYFFTIIVGVGGLGVWVHIVKWQCDMSNLKQSIDTYFIAIMAASAVDLGLKKYTGETEKFSKSYQLGALFILVIGVGIFWATDHVFLKVFGIILSWFIWWLANADNYTMLSERETPPNLNELAGGDEELEGDLDDFIH